MNGLALCAGIGGLELGVGLAVPGYRCVGYVERDAYAAATLVARMADEALDQAPIWDDLESFDGRAWRGVVDLVSAGFPCQPFSSAGKQLGLADERWLWPLVERIIGDVQPRWVVLENVPGLVRHGLGPVLSGLARRGYDAEWGLFRASDVGAPHRRERFFLLGRLAQPAGWGWDSQPVADREGEGLEGLGSGGRPGPERGELADASGVRCGCGQERDVERASEGFVSPQRHDTHGRRLDFPPGPADSDLWARVLREAPETQPALCGVADGSAAWLEHRADRLRALGNGVVPLQAAYAIRSLATRAGWILNG